MLRRSLLAAALTLALGAPALAADYAVDTNHTQAEFSVVHLGFGHVRGVVPVVAGNVSVGANDLPTAVDVTFSAKDLDTHSANRDRELHGPDWFEVDKFPTITFVAKQITGTPQAFKMVGDLTMHGVTKPVTLSCKQEGKLVDARGRTHLAYSASTGLDRREWGLNWGGTVPGGALVAGNEVSIDIAAEVISK